MLKLLAPAMLLYVAFVLGVNLGFSYVPMVPTPIGLLSPMAFVVGGIFVVRDYAQRKVGHLVVVAMVIGIVLSYLMADPFVAIASAAAFAASETADYLIYSITKKPFHKRVILSAAISSPIDTLVFLFGINGFTTGTFVLMILSKVVAAAGIYLYYARRPASALPRLTPTGEDVAVAG